MKTLLTLSLCLAGMTATAQSPQEAVVKPETPKAQVPQDAAVKPEAPKPQAPKDAAAKPETAKTAPQAMPKLDDGLLDPVWFGPGITFTKSSDVDFFWIKDNLDLSGRTIRMAAWEDPAMLKPGRDGKDNAKATELTDSFPGMLRGAINGAMTGKAKVSRTEGDLELIGRFVDINAGSKAAKWLIGMGAGSETATWDLKLVDKVTKEVLLAVHHRAISGTAMSNIQDKLVKWSDKFATFLASKALKQ